MHPTNNTNNTNERENNMEINIVKRVRLHNVSTAADVLQFVLGIIKGCGDWQRRSFISRFEDIGPAMEAVKELMEYGEKHNVISITVANCGPLTFDEGASWSEQLDFCGMLLANSYTAWDKALVDNAISRIAELSSAMS